MDYRVKFLSDMDGAWQKCQALNINKAVLFAQAALESDWGRSGLFKKAFNIFGIKTGTGWKGKTIDLPTMEWSKAKGWYKTVAKWRAYPTLADCITDYNRIINTLSWYKDAVPFAKDSPSEFLKRILPEKNQPGWATDPKYFEKVANTGKEIEKLIGLKWS